MTMKTQNEQQQIRELQQKITELQNELRSWKLNGIYLDWDEKQAYLAMRDAEEEEGIHKQERELDTCIADMLDAVRDDGLSH